ncbi:transposase (plasmid) [Rhizobium sp. 007]|nr:transposase [Rhizobium sp. 007]
MPDHIILTLLPPHSPELNPVENVLQFMGDWIFNDARHRHPWLRFLE